MKSTEAIFDLYLEGLTYAAIASKCGVSRQRIQQIVRPPKAIYDAIKNKSRGKCANCGIVAGSGHIHHVEAEGRTSDTFNEMKNLEYLCPSCHRLAHSKGRRGTIGFRTTTEEWATIESQSKRLNLRISEYVRLCVLNDIAQRQAKGQAEYLSESCSVAASG